MDVFDCREFHELCMDYRGAVLPNGPQTAYERLQAYCRKQQNESYNTGYKDGKAAVMPGAYLGEITKSPRTN